jgi:hypothetical protein
VTLGTSGRTTTPARWNRTIVDALQPPTRTDLVATLRQDEAGQAFTSAERLFAPTFSCALMWPHEHAHYEGPEGLWTAWNDWLRAWRRYVVETCELTATGDRVLVLTRARGVVAADRDPDGRRCLTAGREVEARPATIWRLHDRRLLSAAFYESQLDAFEALGLLDGRSRHC